MSENEIVVKSRFRSIIDNYQILVTCIYYIPIVFAGLIAQGIIVFIFDKTWAINFIYFFVGAGRLIGVGEQPLYLLWGLNALVYWVAISFFIKNLIPKPVKKFLPCDKCKGSVIVFEDWLCDKCEQAQGKDRYVTDGCVWCKQKRSQIRCDRCGIRIDL